MPLTGYNHTIRCERHEEIVNIWESPLWELFERECQWVSWQEILNCFPHGIVEALTHLEEFRTEGFSIRQDPERGCQLLARPDRLYPPWILSHLETKTFGRTLHYATTMVSTQEEAVRLAREGSPEGTAIVCEHQTGGRGRRGRLWQSPPYANLLFSIVIRSPVEARDSFVWTQVASVAIAESVERAIHDRVWIKWPNDLYLCGRKLCGILAEWERPPGRAPFLAIGIGLNVMSCPSDEKRAICLQDVVQNPPPRAALLQWILASFESWCEAVRSSGPRAVWEPWISRSMLLGRRVVVVEEGRETWGRVEGFLPDGRLELSCEGAAIMTFVAGDVSIVPQMDGPVSDSAGNG
jgi:BirA family transcriptional regulator, biotin operon repressor / biotin---[acetyl-CoA-carboxylase] ligase